MNFEEIVKKGNEFKSRIHAIKLKIGSLQARVKKFKPDDNEIIVNGLKMDFDRKEQQAIYRMVCEKTDRLVEQMHQEEEEFAKFQSGIMMQEPEKPKETKSKKDKE